MEAQIFVGKCLANVSKRLSAKELLLDPFLATVQLESPSPCLTVQTIPSPCLPVQTMRYQKSYSAAVANKVYPSVGDQTKNTNMTITGTMNEEDDTVFLKVQISDKNGMYADRNLQPCALYHFPPFEMCNLKNHFMIKTGNVRNIYFPFDTVNDTAMDVAMEMVKELEISDLEPLEIAQMIEEEIIALVPAWKGWGTSQCPRQHSFRYEEEDDDFSNHHPFFSSSSRSSSHGSLQMLGSSKTLFAGNYNNHFSCAQEWLQGLVF